MDNPMVENPEALTVRASKVEAFAEHGQEVYVHLNVGPAMCCG